MVDDALVEMVARDLRANLEARAADVRDVYGFCLWTDDFNGEFLASMATTELSERVHQLPAYASTSDEELRSLDGPLWNVGDWHRFPDDDFLTDDTRAAMGPLVSRLHDPANDADFEAAGAEMRELAFAVYEVVQPLDLLPCTDDAIGYVEFSDALVEERLEVMSRTVPPERLQAFPEWEGGIGT